MSSDKTMHTISSLGLSHTTFLPCFQFYRGSFIFNKKKCLGNPASRSHFKKKKRRSNFSILLFLPLFLLLLSSQVPPSVCESSSKVVRNYPGIKWSAVKDPSSEQIVIDFIKNYPKCNFFEIGNLVLRHFLSINDEGRRRNESLKMKTKWERLLRRDI